MYDFDFHTSRSIACSQSCKFFIVGECRDLKECEENELEDFPRRMREWLFNVMEEMAERSELKAKFSKMHEEAKFDLAKKWRNAAIWKWCELDGKPKDNSVSR